MRRRNYRRQIGKIAFVLAGAVLCFSCGSRFGVSDPDQNSRFLGPRSNLSPEIFEKLGYQVKSFDEGPASDWHRDQFHTLWSRNYFVKNRTSLKEQAATFPRYTVIEEVYETEDQAASRVERIQEKPPDLPIEEREYWMVTGFRRGRNVYFIQTDAAVFLSYMKDFAEKLAGEIPEVKAN